MANLAGELYFAILLLSLYEASGLRDANFLWEPPGRHGGRRDRSLIGRASQRGPIVFRRPRSQCWVRPGG